MTAITGALQSTNDRVLRQGRQSCDAKGLMRWDLAINAHGMTGGRDVWDRTVVSIVGDGDGCEEAVAPS